LSAVVVLRPGLATLADWRGVYRGASVALDPIARADVEAGAAGLQAMLDGAQGPELAESGDASPAVVDLLGRSGDTVPAGLARLTAALKLGALGQGLSGVRWHVVQGLADCLSNDLVPAIPAQNTGNRLALSHLFGLVTGTGEAIAGAQREPAARALKRAGLAPLRLNPHERRAILSGTELSTAFALAGLFEAERIFQSALVAGALSETSRASGTLPYPRIGRLSRQPGQADVAAALSGLFLPAGSESARTDGEGRAEPTSRRRFLAEMGACLDLLRQAGETLERVANGASGDRLVIWQTGEFIEGLEDTSATGLAADLIALALRELSILAERRIADLPAPSGGEPSGNGPVAMLAGFLAEIRERASPAGLPVPSDEPLGHGIARLLPVAGTTSLIIAIEFLAAARVSGPARTDALDAVQKLLHGSAGQPASGDAISVADLAGAADLVRSGALAAATGIELPSVLRHPG
jgi:histidine ammonia-lyase